MQDNKVQFRFRIIEMFTHQGSMQYDREGPWVEEKEIAGHEVDDPFITSTIRPKGWRVAWAVLLGRYRLRVIVDGTPAAYRVVFTGDYTPPVRGRVVHAGIDIGDGKK